MLIMLIMLVVLVVLLQFIGVVVVAGASMDARVVSQ